MSSADDATEPSSAPADTTPPERAAAQPPAEEAIAEPAFTPGMSVNAAIAAVPKGAEYIGLDPDALGRPLADLELYAPCKLNPSQHFKLRVAIWNGKAVGIDVTSSNNKLAGCVKEQVAQVVWRDKVKAVNTVDYAY